MNWYLGRLKKLFTRKNYTKLKKYTPAIIATIILPGGLLIPFGIFIKKLYDKKKKEEN